MVGTITISGLYTAPSVVPNPATVTITAIASADTTKSASATVTVTAPLHATVKLLSPNGGEILRIGATFTIRWGAPANAVSFMLTYFDGAKWQAVGPSRVTGTSHSWTVPAAAASRAVCRMKMVGYDARGQQMGVDQSDRPFAIRR
jgi:hypothetical protein